MTQLIQHPQLGSVQIELIDNNPWFVVKDVCNILDIGNTSKAVLNLDEDEKLTLLLVRSGQKRAMSLVNESGLYNLIFRSNKPEAKVFRKWVTSEVLPSIRKTGKYESQIERQKKADRNASVLLLSEMQKSLYYSDVRLVAKSLRMEATYVVFVLCGRIEDVPVMEALYKRSVNNKLGHQMFYMSDGALECLTLLQEVKKMATVTNNNKSLSEIYNDLDQIKKEDFIKALKRKTGLTFNVSDLV